MKLKNWRDNINYVRTFMRKSFQKVWSSFWVLLQKWVNVVEMKNVPIWLVLKKELERKVVMIQMNNDRKRPSESLNFDDVIDYYL